MEENTFQQSATKAITAQDAHAATSDAPLEMVRRTSLSDTSIIRITTSVATQKCAKRCPCQCHTQTPMRSPTWLKTIIGQMLFSYHGLLRTTPRNFPPCRQTARKTEFTYYFPQWLAKRALIMSSVSDMAGRGASISIAMPIIIPGNDRIWSVIQYGNIARLQQFFCDGYSPYMVDEMGQSFAAVRKSFSSPSTLVTREAIASGPRKMYNGHKVATVRRH